MTDAEIAREEARRVLDTVEPWKRAAMADEMRFALLRRAYLRYCERWGEPPAELWVSDLVLTSWTLLTPIEQAIFRVLEDECGTEDDCTA